MDHVCYKMTCACCGGLHNNSQAELRFLDVRMLRGVVLVLLASNVRSFMDRVMGGNRSM